MDGETIKIIVAVCVTVPSAVFGFIFFGKRMPKFKHPFLWGLAVLLVLVGIIVGLLFANVWAGLVFACITMPIYFMYMWYGTKAITQRWNDNISKEAKKYEDKKDEKESKKYK